MRLVSEWADALGELELFFDRVCSPRSETSIHILEFLSLQKQLILLFFFLNCKLGHISTGFLPQNSWFYHFFTMGPFSDFFLPKGDPCQWIFGRKVTHLCGTSPCLNMWVPPGLMHLKSTLPLWKVYLRKVVCLGLPCTLYGRLDQKYVEYEIAQRMCDFKR